MAALYICNRLLAQFGARVSLFNDIGIPKSLFNSLKDDGIVFPKHKLSFNNNDDYFYVPTKKCIYLPVNSIPNLEHELAHMLEMNDFARLTQVDFGFWFNRPITVSASAAIAAMSRESRVRAIQARLINKSLSDCKITNNPIWADDIAAHLPFGRFMMKQDVIDWSDDIAEKTYNAWNVDRIDAEWKRRVDYLLDWMNTSA